MIGDPAPAGETGLMLPEDMPREPDVPLRDLDELLPQEPSRDGPDQVEEDGKALRDQVIEELNRDITPDQASLIERLGGLLDRASTAELPRPDRSAAIVEAERLIELALEREQDEIMRYRPQALGGIGRERRRLDLGLSFSVIQPVGFEQQFPFGRRTPPAVLGSGARGRQRGSDRASPVGPVLEHRPVHEQREPSSQRTDHRSMSPRFASRRSAIGCRSQTVQ